MGKSDPIRRLTAILFICILLVGFINNGSYNELQKFSEYLQQKDLKADGLVDAYFSSRSWIKHDLIDLNGSMAKLLNMQGFYSSMGIYITNNNYIVSATKYTSTDYEAEETINFRDFLESNGVKFLYVNEPTKYIDDSLFVNQFGVETYCNRNMDLFLSRIKEAGVNYIDLRDNIKDEKMNISDLFYRTDHHWTTDAGLWATQIISEGLNNYCAYNIETTLYNIDNYNVKEWNNCWLGEQGRKVAESYVGLDNYTEIKPNFGTNYTFKNVDGTTWDGTFENFINEGVYNTENDVYENESWHYSYSNINCINNNVDNGMILIIGDSYNLVIQPFLSLGVHEVDSLILRDYNDTFSLRNYILANDYDTVIVAYAQFMVGAHDDETSANYRMFSFDY